MATPHGLRTITGTTNAARLQFAVQFAQLDLESLRPGDWLNVRADLQIFLFAEGQETPRALRKKIEAGTYGKTYPSHGGIIAAELPGHKLTALSVDAIAALQAETLRLLTDVVDSRETPPEVPYTRQNITVSAPTLWGIAHLYGRNQVIVQGTARDMFLLVLLLLLKDEPTDRILRCPECQTLFYRTRKQLFCSRPCVNRANVRTWRESAEGQQKEQERGRARYQKKKAPARVQTRRPRPGNPDEQLQ